MLLSISFMCVPKAHKIRTTFTHMHCLNSTNTYKSHTQTVP